MTQLDIHLFNSAESIIHLNTVLLDWFGQGFFLTWFAIGFIFWAIRFLTYNLVAPIGLKKELRAHAFLNMVLGPVLCLFLILPIARFDHLQRNLDVAEAQFVTPCAALAYGVIGKGSDQLTSKIIFHALGFDRVFETQENFRAQQFMEARTRWFANFIAYPLFGVEAKEALEMEAGFEPDESVRDDEGGILQGVRNMLGSSRNVFNALERMGTIVVVFATNPWVLITYTLGLLILLILSMWVGFLGYALPFLFVAIVFLLPFSYLFNGMQRVLPLLKMLVAMALAKPLAILFIAIGFNVIDAYMLNLVNSTDIPAISGQQIATIFDGSFFATVQESGVTLQWSTPIVLAVLLASTIFALFAPIITFLILGAEGGTMAGFISSTYLYLATTSAKAASGPLKGMVGGIPSAS